MKIKLHGEDFIIIIKFLLVCIKIKIIYIVVILRKLKLIKLYDMYNFFLKQFKSISRSKISNLISWFYEKKIHDFSEH